MATPFLIAGVSGTSTDMQVLVTLIKQLPTSEHITYIVHIETQEALNTEFLTKLQQHTPLTLRIITHELALVAEHLYIVPIGAHIDITDGVFKLAPIQQQPQVMPVDYLFSSLAEYNQEHTIGIICSSANNDGILGLRRIKEHGGLVIVQDPRETTYANLPQNAISAGLGDTVSRIEQIRVHLKQQISQFQRVPAPQHALAEEAIQQILYMIQQRHHHDFSGYKRSTIIRRIERRIGMHTTGNPDAYIEHLQTNHEELDRLFNDLLISVTCFFRDPEAFGILEGLIAKMIEEHTEDRPLRVWVPGCATGEEVYSIAILFQEQLTAQQKTTPLQIFATDIDQQALETARQGIYPDHIKKDLSPQQLKQFFTQEKHGYRIAKHIREWVVFASQNLTTDPPFSRLDLVSCRNVLIYLDTAVQRRVISLFHFALAERGILFLGNAETVGSLTNLYNPISKKWRIYQRHHGQANLLVYPSRSQTLEERNDSNTAQTAFQEHIHSPKTLVQQHLLRHHTPTVALVNPAFDCIYLHNSSASIFAIPTGEPSQHLLHIIQDYLRPTVRMALHQAARKREKTFTSTINLDPQAPEVVHVTVEPVTEIYFEGFLVVFNIQPHTTSELAVKQPETHTSLVQHLEQELMMMRTDLQHTIEDLETTNEELKAANEQVMSMNEELQSTNEELETSKEELQSLNEELITINMQLQDKVSELEITGNDLLNLLRSTDIATLFLDINLCIKRFTPATKHLFNLITSDIGRPISDISQKFRDDDLYENAALVIQTLQPQVREISDPAQRWYIRRILPYRTVDNRIEGVVITFTEVTELKRIQNELRIAKERFQFALANSPITMFSQDLEFHYTWMHNSPLPYSDEYHLGKTDYDMFTLEEAQQLTEIKQAVLDTRQAIQTEMELTIDGNQSFFDMTITPVYDLRDTTIGITCVATNITEHKAQEHERELLLKREQVARESAEKAVQMRDTFLSIASHELKTPLTALYGNAQVLNRRLKSINQIEPRDTLVIGNIVAQAQRLTQLINMLLDVSQIEKGQLDVHLDLIELGTFVEQIVISLQSAFDSHRLILNGPSSPIHIQADSLRLEQVLYNLINNAVKYSPNAHQVEIQVGSQDQWAKISIKDGGIGIPQQDLEAIFERFYRVPDHKRIRISGIGVGLYVVHEIIRLHNGRIEVASVPGQGSTFTIFLPWRSVFHPTD